MRYWMFGKWGRFWGGGVKLSLMKISGEWDQLGFIGLFETKVNRQ
jgi:hypothetical protein